MSDPAKEPVVRIEGVTKIFQRGSEKVHALRGIDLEVEAGNYVSIMGPSGSGKSTLFNMIGGLDSPTEGDVWVHGFKLAKLNSKQLAWVRCNRIGFIFQSFNLVMTMTALENVAIARIFSGIEPQQAREDAAAMLERVGLGHRLDHLPGEVSGGQQQRIAIARALVNRPSIVLADEPTGNLDLHTGEEIIEVLAELKREMGITIITATHDMKMLSASDAVIWIKDGAVERVARHGEMNIEIGSIDGETTI